MPLGELERLQALSMIDALLPVVQQIQRPTILVIHGVPTRLCRLPDLQATECTQLPVPTFSNLTTIPYVLPYGDEEFDAVILKGVLDNALDISKLVFEAQRTLKPAGTLLIDGTNRSWASWLRHVLFQRLLRVEPPYYRNWRLLVAPFEANRVLEAYGFTSIHFDYFTTSLSLPQLFSDLDILGAINVDRTTDQQLYYTVKAINKAD